MSLTILKNTYLTFRRMRPSMGLCGVYSGYAFSAGTSQKWCCVGSNSHPEAQRCFLSLQYHANVDHLVTLGSVVYLHLKFIISPFLSNSYFVGRYSKITLIYILFLVRSPPLAFIDVSAWISHLCDVAKWWWVFFFLNPSFLLHLLIGILP